MIKRRIKQGSAFILAIAVAFSVLVLPKVYAANGVDTDRECAIQVNLRNSGFSELTGESAIPVTVSLYKVADVNVSGEYTAVSEFSVLAEALAEVDSETTAGEWIEWAAEAKELIESEEIAAAYIESAGYGEVTLSGLETGLYLLDVDQVMSDTYVYDFTPYLISLPNNQYYATGEDTWVYELLGENAISLKVTRTDRLGELVINKVLDTYNTSVGGATFVFQIEATKEDVDLPEGDPERTKVVYSNVVSMTFDGPGTDSITIKDLPAGAEVTVTEVYSGASYTVTTDAAAAAQIVAEDSVSVDFVNTYDGRLNGGYGIVNSFTYDSATEGWIPSQSEDSTP